MTGVQVETLLVPLPPAISLQTLSGTRKPALSQLLPPEMLKTTPTGHLNCPPRDRFWLLLLSFPLLSGGREIIRELVLIKSGLFTFNSV